MAFRKDNVSIKLPRNIQKTRRKVCPVFSFRRKANSYFTSRRKLGLDGKRLYGGKFLYAWNAV